MRRLLCHPRVRAFFLVLWGIGWCVVLYMSLRPLQEMPLGLSDKTLHLTGYALMTLLTVGFCHIPARLLRLALGTVAASAGIEMIQGLLPYRTFELLDLAANATGATLGLIAALVLLGLLRPGEIRRPAPS